MKKRFLILFALAIFAGLTRASGQTIVFFGANPAFADDGVTLKSCPVQVTYALSATVDGITATAQRSVSFDAADAKNAVTIGDITLTPAQWYKFAEAFAAREVPAKKQQEQEAKAAQAAAKAAAAEAAPPPEE